MIFLIFSERNRIESEGEFQSWKNAKFAVAAEVQFERETYLP